MEEKKKKVLLIDDDTFLLEMYAIKFKKYGFDVAAVGSPEEALRALRGGMGPDLIIVDLIMPGIDGLELLREVRKENLAPAAAVVVLTNQSQLSDVEKAKDVGVDGYIVKATTIPSEVVEETIAIYNKKNKK